MAGLSVLWDTYQHPNPNSPISEVLPSSVTPADLERPTAWPKLTEPEQIAALVARFRAALPAEMAGQSDTYDARDGLVSEYARVLLETIRH